VPSEDVPGVAHRKSPPAAWAREGQPLGGAQGRCPRAVPVDTASPHLRRGPSRAGFAAAGGEFSNGLQILRVVVVWFDPGVRCGEPLVDLPPDWAVRSARARSCHTRARQRLLVNRPAGLFLSAVNRHNRAAPNHPDATPPVTKQNDPINTKPHDGRHLITTVT
jgi:hypothetical protein